jgi:hypothetical protein
MNALVAWFKSKNITSHSIAVAIVGLASLIMTDETVRNFILGFFTKRPDVGVAIVSLAGIILKYSHSSSPAGAVAQAKAVLSEPDAPTAKQVDAATPKP